ncbi:MAG: hypothetical protein OXC15_18070 [Rhodospirillaceae bacterium]|nr:hypothetical protein [Rhodospirillaceae bacterium]
MGEIWPAIFGVIGVLSGVIANELLHRRRRIESYSARVFDVRLGKYSELVALLNSGYEIATEVMENTEHSKEERHSLISEVVLGIARFLDRNELFIDEEVRLQGIAAFMGAEDVLDIEDANKQEEERNTILQSYAQARKLIREHSGVAEVDKFFKRVAKPTSTSPAIDYFLQIKKDYNRAEQ